MEHQSTIEELEQELRIQKRKIWIQRMLSIFLIGAGFAGIGAYLGFKVAGFLFLVLWGNNLEQHLNQK